MAERVDSTDLDSESPSGGVERPFIDRLEELAYKLKSYQRARQKLKAVQTKVATGQELTVEESEFLESLRDY